MSPAPVTVSHCHVSCDTGLCYFVKGETDSQGTCLCSCGSFFCRVTSRSSGALCRGLERQSSRSFGSCRKLKPQLEPGSYRSTRKPSGSHAIFKQKPLRTLLLATTPAQPGSCPVDSATFPKSLVVSARHSCSQRTSHDKAGTYHFRLKETQEKLHLHRLGYWSDKDSLHVSKHQDPGALYWNGVNRMWQPAGFSFFCISFLVQELLA